MYSPAPGCRGPKAPCVGGGVLDALSPEMALEVGFFPNYSQALKIVLAPVKRMLSAQIPSIIAYAYYHASGKASVLHGPKTLSISGGVLDASSPMSVLLRSVQRIKQRIVISRVITVTKLFI